MQRAWFPDVAGGVAGAAAFVAALFALQLPVWLAAVAAVVVYAGLRLLLSGRIDPVAAKNSALAREAVTAGDGHLRTIRQLSKQIQTKSVQDRVLRICALADNILDDLRQKPSDLVYAPNFVDGYLTPVENVLSRYVRLSSQGLGQDARPTLSKIEDDLLPKVEQNFSRLYQQLMQNDVIDLDASAEGLKSLLDTEV